jgi:hypothetical protein
MALPKIDVPEYECILPSNKKKVRFRPFLVKEQKLLLMASEATEIKDSVEAMKKVVKNCVLGELDVDALPVFDLEFLFLNLRARSVGEVVKVKYKCNNIIQHSESEEEEDKRCNNVVDIDINVLEINPEFGPNHSNKIELSDKLGVVFNYPTFEMAENLNGKSENEVIFDLIVKCINYIYDDEQMYYAKDSSQEELIEFIDGLHQEHMEKIKDFFETLPKIKKEVHFDCKKCGHHEDIMIEGIQNFFV